MFAGAALNYTPDQLQKAFGPQKITFDTTDIFGINSLEVPSTKSNRSTDLANVLSQTKDPTERLLILSRMGQTDPKEQLDAYMPFMMKMREFDANLADKNAQRKFGQEMLAAGFGTLGRGIQTSIAGGSPEMIAYLADAPIRNADAYLSARRGQPRQEIPVFAPQPLPNRQYYA